MDSNPEGKMWVKLMTQGSSSRKSDSAQEVIPIKWIFRSKYSGQTQHANSSEVKDMLEVSEGTAEMSKQDFSSNFLSSSSDALETASNFSRSASKIKEDDLCIVCMERQADLQVLPCKHDQFCRSCVVRLVQVVKHGTHCE